MPKDYPTEVVQPMGSHNSLYPCVRSKHIKEYMSFPYEFLNPVQSEFIRYLEDHDTNIVLSAPTSSGKTKCIEFFMAEAIKNFKKRALYIAPMKALADEKFEEWTSKEHPFSQYNVEIQTGDFELTEEKKKNLLKSHIIILTPEMFNSKCRFYSQHEWLHDTVNIIDECHLIGMKDRGDALEAGLIQYFENDPKARTLFVSATIPNVKDFKVWLEHLTGRKTECIISNYRPCKLNEKWVPVTDSKGGRGITYAEKEVNRMAVAVKQIQAIKDHPVIVFVGSKDFGYKLTRQLNLIEIPSYFHNADANRETRKKIESDFRDGSIKVIIATTTLAWGCLTGSTQVILDNGWKDIKNILPTDIVRFSTSDKKVRGGAQTNILEHKEEKVSIYRITLDNGLSIECTEDHLFPVDGEEKEASSLKVGEQLSVVGVCNENVYFTKEKPESYYLIGAIAGDGWFKELDKNSYRPIIVCKPEDYRKKLIDLCYDLNINCIDDKDYFGTPIISLSRSKEFINFLSRNIKYDENKFKIIDYNLLRANDDIVLNILAGLMDTDGGIESNKICFYNTSYHLINFFVLAARRFGISTKVRCRKANEVLREINGRILQAKKTCYELYFGTSRGVEFFYKKVIPHMKHPQKIEDIRIRAYGSCKRMKKNDFYFKFGFFRNKKSLSFVKQMVLYCSKESTPLSYVEKNISEKTRTRKDYFEDIFDVSHKKINGFGRERKHYQTKDFLRQVPLENKIDLAKYLVQEVGYDPDFDFNDRDANIILDKYKIKEMEVFERKQKVFDVNLIVDNDNNRHYYANGIMTHNCNMPARYVIITHTEFGMTPMEPSNIHQSMGRAGRAGYASEGDAIILCERKKLSKEKQRVHSGYKVNSTLNSINTLCFHILSYLVNGHIKNSTDLSDWYKKTLSYIQNPQINEANAQKVLDNLSSRGMIKYDKEKKEYTATRLGDITARMYMSPLDVSDWFKNFSRISHINPPRGTEGTDIARRVDFHVALCLSECYQWGRTWFSSKTEEYQAPSNAIYISKREANCQSVIEVGKRVGLDPTTNPHLKYTACFLEILTGRDSSPELKSFRYAMIKDAERIIQTLKQIDMQIGKHAKGAGKCKGFSWGHEWDILGSRLKYGVGSEMIDLVNIEGIGRAYAKKLYDNGIKNEKDLKSPVNLAKVTKILGENRSKKILETL